MLCKSKQEKKVLKTSAPREKKKDKKRIEANCGTDSHGRGKKKTLKKGGYVIPKRNKGIKNYFNVI